MKIQQQQALSLRLGPRPESSSNREGLAVQAVQEVLGDQPALAHMDQEE